LEGNFVPYLLTELTFVMSLKPSVLKPYGLLISSKC